MRYLLLVILALLLAPAEAGDVMLELGTGYETRPVEGDESPMGIFRLRYEAFNNQWWKPDVVEFDHHSNITDGWPFNDRPEDTTDQFSVIWRIKLF